MRSLHSPFFKGPKGALQLYLGLYQLEIGIQLLDVTVALFDSGFLLVARGRGGNVWVTCAVLNLGHDRVQVFLRVVALQPSDLLLCPQFRQTAGELTRLLCQLKAKEVGLL